jgi:hypothetical protein
MALHLTADLQASYRRFVTRVRETGVVWGLRNADGWAQCPSNEYEAYVLLFWSHEAYARRHAVEVWADYAPASIPLAEFLDAWLPGMHADGGALAGVEFNADLAGLEVEPRDLALDLLA